MTHEGQSGVYVAGGQGQAGSMLRYNRTGATSVKGGTGLLDILNTQGESTTIGTGLQNVTPVTTAGMAVGIVGVWEAAGVGDNAQGRFITGEGVECSINVDSTTDIAKGDALKCVNAGDHMVKATPATDRHHAIALEARTADTEGAIRALLFSSGRF